MTQHSELSVLYFEAQYEDRESAFGQLDLPEDAARHWLEENHPTALTLVLYSDPDYRDILMWSGPLHPNKPRKWMAV